MSGIQHFLNCRVGVRARDLFRSSVRLGALSTQDSGPPTPHLFPLCIFPFSSLGVPPLHSTSRPQLVLRGLASGLGNSSSLTQIFCVILDATLALRLPQSLHRYFGEGRGGSLLIQGFGGSEVTHLGCQAGRSEGCWELRAPGGSRSGAHPEARLCPPR